MGELKTIMEYYKELSPAGMMIVMIIWMILNHLHKRQADKTGRKICDFIENQNDINGKLETYLEVATNKYAENVTKSQAEKIVQRVYQATEQSIKCFSHEIIKKNDIPQKQEQIKLKLQAHVDALFADDKQTLHEFKYHGNRIDQILCVTEKDKIIKKVTDLVLNGQDIDDIKVFLQQRYSQRLSEAKGWISDVQHTMG